MSVHATRSPILDLDERLQLWRSKHSGNVTPGDTPGLPERLHQIELARIESEKVKMENENLKLKMEVARMEAEKLKLLKESPARKGQRFHGEGAGPSGLHGQIPAFPVDPNAVPLPTEEDSEMPADEAQRS